MLAQVTELRESLNLLERVLGAKLIKQEVHKIDGWNPEGAPGLHLLVLLWYKTKEDLALAEVSGVLPNSIWVKRTLELGALLKDAEHNDYEQLLEGLGGIDSWQLIFERVKVFAEWK